MFGQRKKSRGAVYYARSADGEESHISTNSNNIAFKIVGDERQKSLLEVYFLGIVPDIEMSNSLTRDWEAQLVDRIEEAQIEGRLPVSGQEDSKVLINVSTHGIKIKDLKGQEVLQRHPLHTIAQVVQYSDGGTVNNIAFKIGNVNKSVFSAYVFQCMSEDQAARICQQVREMFDRITEKNR